ncbi:MAG: hypothetical protein ACUZ8H_06740 [Candidatus Anammoxibacter sp.]
MKNIFLIILFSLIQINSAFAVTAIIKTVKPSGGDYTTLEAALNANEQNLVSTDSTFQVNIDGVWSSADTTKVRIQGWTTDATHWIHINVLTDARHSGLYTTDAYHLESTGDDRSIYAFESYITLDGLQIKGTSSGSGNQVIYTNGSYADGIFINCIILCQAGSTNGIWISSSNSPPYHIYNNMIYNCSANGIITGGVGNPIYAYNNTIYGNGVGIAEGVSGHIVAKNNISYNNTTDYSGTFSTASTHNLAKDTTAPEHNTFYDSKTLTFVSVTGGSEDFHLVSGDTDAIDKGTDLSGEFFDDDCEGVVRSGTWDLGACEFVSAGPAVIETYFYGIESYGIKVN